MSITHVRKKSQFLPLEKWPRLQYTVYSIQQFVTLVQVTDSFSLTLIVGNSIKTNYNLFHIWNWLLCLTKVPFYALIFGKKLRTESIYSMLWQWHDPNYVFEWFFFSIALCILNAQVSENQSLVKQQWVIFKIIRFDECKNSDIRGFFCLLISLCFLLFGLFFLFRRSTWQDK